MHRIVSMKKRFCGAEKLRLRFSFTCLSVNIYPPAMARKRKEAPKDGMATAVHNTSQKKVKKDTKKTNMR